jgi:hypothetical protein
VTFSPYVRYVQLRPRAAARGVASQAQQSPTPPNCPRAKRAWLALGVMRPAGCVIDPLYRYVPIPQHAASRSKQPTAFDNAAGVASKVPQSPASPSALIGTVAMASAIWPCGPPGQSSWPGGPQGQYRVRERRAAEATVAAVTASQWMALVPGTGCGTGLLNAQSVKPASRLFVKSMVIASLRGGAEEFERATVPRPTRPLSGFGGCGCRQP